MDGAIWGFIGVVVGGLIAGTIAIVAERIRGANEASLDGARRQDDRRLGRDDSQRETLLRLQDAVNDAGVAASAVFHHMLVESRPGTWGRLSRMTSTEER